jgi:uncharacterized protein YbaA (DUF1428 family)
MAYVDGFLIPLPKKNKAAYKKMARTFGKVCMELGAIAYHECIADDVKVGKLTSFPRALKLKKGELVMFSWVVYPSKAVRKSVNKKFMKDPRLAAMMDPKSMPFDGKRMIYGGFKTFVEF